MPGATRAHGPGGEAPHRTGLCTARTAFANVFAVISCTLQATRFVQSLSQYRGTVRCVPRSLNNIEMSEALYLTSTPSRREDTRPLSTTGLNRLVAACLLLLTAGWAIAIEPLGAAVPKGVGKPDTVA